MRKIGLSLAALTMLNFSGNTRVDRIKKVMKKSDGTDVLYGHKVQRKGKGERKREARERRMRGWA